MFAIACSLLALAISVIAVWRSGRPKVVFDQEKLKRALNKQYFISQLEKAGRNPPAPTNFQKPEPTPDPPHKRTKYCHKNPVPREEHHPFHCNDIHIGDPVPAARLGDHQFHDTGNPHLSPDVRD